MGGQHGIGERNTDSETPPFNGYTITGTLTPNATGHYGFMGHSGSNPYYEQLEGPFYLCHSLSLHQWVISLSPCFLNGPRWIRNSDDPVGTFAPVFPASGTATCAEGWS